MLKQPSARLGILNGWKEIANYLGKGVRTVQRYERELGLPIRRPAGKSTGLVIATKAELEAWVVASPIRDAFPLPQAAIEVAPLLNEFKRHVADMHQLREEAKQIRRALRTEVETLRRNVQSGLLGTGPQTPSPDPILKASERRLLADVLTFDPKRKVN